MKHSKGSVRTDGYEGRLAQLEERLVCNQKAGGSNPPASTLPLIVKRRVRFATLFIHIVRCTALAPASTTLREFELGKVWTTWVSTHKDHSL